MELVYISSVRRRAERFTVGPHMEVRELDGVVHVLDDGAVLLAEIGRILQLFESPEEAALCAERHNAVIEVMSS